MNKSPSNFIAHCAWAVLLYALTSSAASVAVSGAEQFELRYSANEGICAAYVQKLRMTHFEDQPYCDRPEIDSAPGFQKLSRVPLTDSEVIALFPQAEGLTRYGDPRYFEKLPDIRQVTGDKRIIQQWEPFLREHRSAVQRGGLPLAYRFDPQVDLDNDDMLDDVAVWRQSGLKCGAQYQNFVARSSTHLLFLKDGKIDIEKTRTLFGHPRGNAFVFNESTDEATTIEAQHRFRSFGGSLGVLRFEDTFLMDTFYSPGGDLDNHRDGQKDFLNTIALIRLAGGKPTVMCEVLWRPEMTR